jgi:hypothetical protein
MACHEIDGVNGAADLEPPPGFNAQEQLIDLSERHDSYIRGKLNMVLGTSVYG